MKKIKLENVNCHLNKLLKDKKFKKAFDKECKKLSTKDLQVGVLLNLLLSIFTLENAIEWLGTPNEYLGNNTPSKEIICSKKGIQNVINLLGRIEWGILD